MGHAFAQFRDGPPGVFLVFVGFWMVSDQGPIALGWACVALGQAFLIVGAVAKGIVWGLELHRAGRV